MPCGAITVHQAAATMYAKLLILPSYFGAARVGEQRIAPVQAMVCSHHAGLVPVPVPTRIPARVRFSTKGALQQISSEPVLTHPTE